MPRCPFFGRYRGRSSASGERESRFWQEVKRSWPLASRYIARRRGRNTEMIMSKPSKEFINPKTLIAPAAAVYSHIAKVNRGTIVYISGQVSSDASGKIIGEGDFEAQVEQVFANLKIAVEAAGGVMADIVKLNYFLAAEVD